MDLRELECLVALREEGSFSRAAERLYRSTPTVSRTIRSLERRLAHELVVRSRRGVVLTPTGQQVYVRARALLARYEDSPLSRVAPSAPGAGVSVRVGVTGSAPPAFVTLLTGAVRGLQDVDDVTVTVGTSAGILNELRHGRLDVGGVHLPAPAVDGISVTALHTYGWHVAMRADDPLATLPRLTWEDVEPDRVVPPAYHAGSPALGVLRDRVEAAGRLWPPWSSRDAAAVGHLVHEHAGLSPTIDPRYGGWPLVLRGQGLTTVRLHEPQPVLRFAVAFDPVMQPLVDGGMVQRLVDAFEARWSG